MTRHETFGTRPIGILLLLALAGCGREAPPPGRAPEAPEVRVAKAAVQALVRTEELPGSVEPVRVARLSSPAEGPVQGVAVREGDAVVGGQVLLKIGRARGVQGRLDASREDERKAADELARVGRLVQKGAVPGEWLDRARADYERARAGTTAGEESLADFRVRAPWSGIVAKVPVEDWNYVAPRALLVEIFDPASLVVRIALPETVAARVTTGTVARVRFDALPGREFPASVTRLYPELDRRLRTRTAELTLPAASGLAPGMFARVTLPVESVPDAVAIPRAALVPAPDGRPSVFVAKDGKAVRRVVDIGVETPDRVQVRTGIQAGEEVIVSGLLRVKEGAPVRIQPAGPDAEASR